MEKRMKIYRKVDVDDVALTFKCPNLDCPDYGEEQMYGFLEVLGVTPTCQYCEQNMKFDRVEVKSV